METEFHQHLSWWEITSIDVNLTRNRAELLLHLRNHNAGERQHSREDQTNSGFSEHSHLPQQEKRACSQMRENRPEEKTVCLEAELCTELHDARSSPV